MVDTEMMEQFKLVVDSVGQMMQDMEQRMTEKFQGVETHFKYIEAQIQDVETRMTEKIQGVEERMTEKIQNVEAQIQDVEERMTEKIQDVETRMTEKIAESEHNVKLYMELNVEKRIDALFDGYKLTHEKQWELEHETERLKGQVDSLEARVASLEKKQSA